MVIETISPIRAIMFSRTFRVFVFYTPTQQLFMQIPVYVYEKVIYPAIEQKF